MGIFKYTATALTLALSLAATAPASAQEKKTYHVGAAVYGPKGEFMQLWANSLKEHPLVKDGTVKVTIYDGKYDALTQNPQFDTLITQKRDGILFVAIDAQAGAEAVNKAYAAKIPVVGSNTRVKTDKLTSYVGSNDVIAGEMEAESVIKAMGGKGNVVILEGPIGQSAQIERRKGNENVLAKYAVRAVKAGNMVSVLQDAKAQAQGSLDVLMRAVIGASYKPRSPIWEHYKSVGLNWGDGTAKDYSIPWTPITTQNADAMLAGN